MNVYYLRKFRRDQLRSLDDGTMPVYLMEKYMHILCDKYNKKSGKAIKITKKNYPIWFDITNLYYCLHEDKIENLRKRRLIEKQFSADRFYSNLIKD